MSEGSVPEPGVIHIAGGGAGTARRRRAGLPGMRLAELCEVARKVGVVDPESMRRRDLVAAINSTGRWHEPLTSYARDATWVMTHYTNDHQQPSALLGDAEVIEVGGVPIDQLDSDVEIVEVLANDGDSKGEPEPSTEQAQPTATLPPAPPRALSLAALLLAPEERENWLGELRTAMWEFRADPRGRRTMMRGFARGLVESLVVSWRHGGGPSRQETS